jgi:NADPH:quinone reductase-like Zn-dependent oxidoreductase/SAM-dependent methyltransferase
MILYPGAGMLVMAIEAMKQLADDSNRSIHGFELKDVKLITALVIPATTTGVEIQFTVRQNLEVGSKEISWSNFRLYSNIDDKWTEVCSGSVRIDPGIALSEIHGQNEVEKTRQYHAQCWAESIKECTQDVDINQLYEFCKSCGFDYGPNFQVLNEAKFSNTKAKAQVKPFEWIAQGEVNPPQPHVIHPTTLDGFLQLAMVTYTRGGTVKANTLVPSYIRKIWISNSGLASPETNSINVSSEIVTQDNRGIEVELLAMKNGSQDLCARLEGVRMTFVAGSSDLDDQMPQRHNLWNLAWAPDLELLEATDRAQVQAYCKTHRDDTEKFGNLSFYTNLTFVLFAALSRMMRETKDIGRANLPSHLKKYLSWADWQIQKYQNEVFVLRGSKITWAALCLDDEYVDAVCQLISVTNAQGKVSAAVARNLVKILRNEVDALELLFQSDLLENLYQELTDANYSFIALDKYLGTYMHQHPHSRYLEIGAGTGGSTGNILRTLSGHRNPLVSPAMYTDYTYTDISESFFEKAKAKFGDYQNMTFKRLNIEQIPSEQGFTPESYDVIIAANVIHATSDLEATLRNACELLRPGGKLILYEITQPDILRSNFIMGLLPGWWRSSEEYRTMGPCLREDQWHKVLGENGFTGVDYEFRDYDDETCHELSILISTKSSSAPTQTVTFDSVIVTEQNSEVQRTFINQLQSTLTLSKGLPTQVATLRETVNSEFDPPSVLILTDELFQPILHNLTDGKFADLQHTLIKANTVVWLTRTTSDGSASPLHSLVDGLARVLRVENASCKFVVIGLETSTEFSVPRIEAVVRIIQRTVDAALEQYDSAFEEKNGVFNVCRLQISEETGDEMYKRTLPKISGHSVWGKSPPLRLTIGSPGILDTLHFEEDAHYNDPILADEVEIEVRAVGLNFKDCLMALGQVGGQSLGLECSGVVTRVGSDSRFTPGDRVCMSTTEAFKTFARSKMQCVCKIPDGLSFAEAAALPVQFVTAWTSINLLGRLQKGESVLIHAGAGGTGQAAIQMAQYIGAEIFVTVGSNTKKQLLMAEYGLSEDHILYSRDTSFADHIKRLTGGRGVDVILNSLAGDSLVASWECLASYGRFVEIGKKDILSNSGLPMFRFHDNVTFAAFDGSRWMLDRPAEAQRGIETVIDMYSKGNLHAARPLHVYSIADTIKAFRMLADGKSSGKAVLEIKPDAAVPVSN